MIQHLHFVSSTCFREGEEVQPDCRTVIPHQYGCLGDPHRLRYISYNYQISATFSKKRSLISLFYHWTMLGLMKRRLHYIGGKIFFPFLPQLFKQLIQIILIGMTLWDLRMRVYQITSRICTCPT